MKQSNNQPIIKSINQTIKQSSQASINQPIKQAWLNQSIQQADHQTQSIRKIGLAINQTINPTTKTHANQSIKQLMIQPMNQDINPIKQLCQDSINQPTNQPTNQTINRPNN